MLERSQIALKVFCGAMALLLVYRLCLVIAHVNPLYHLSIPALPSLASASTSNDPSTTSTPAPAGKGTTNLPGHALASSTNSAISSTNLAEQASKSHAPETNSAVRGTLTGSSGTNGAVAKMNLVEQATNSAGPIGKATNLVSSKSAQVPDLPRPGHGMPPTGPMPGGTKPGPELPREIQARVDRVIDSEILAPVMRPLPMALLGIAGDQVFLRAPSGQTGLVKEGEELGGVKLVRIGTNRVLVEEQGERKELTIFAGLGSESLLSTQNGNSK
jgi:hypothetical protein